MCRLNQDGILCPFSSPCTPEIIGFAIEKLTTRLPPDIMEINTRPQKEEDMKKLTIFWYRFFS